MYGNAKSQTIKCTIKPTINTIKKPTTQPVSKDSTA